MVQYLLLWSGICSLNPFTVSVRSLGLVNRQFVVQWDRRLDKGTVAPTPQDKRNKGLPRGRGSCRTVLTRVSLNSTLLVCLGAETEGNPGLSENQPLKGSQMAHGTEGIKRVVGVLCATVSKMSTALPLFTPVNRLHRTFPTLNLGSVGLNYGETKTRVHTVTTRFERGPLESLERLGRDF